MPEAWSPGGDFGSPTYSIPIKVVDGVRSTFIGERRRRWRQGVDAALASWMLPFDLSYRPEAEQTYVATDESVSNLSINPLIIPGSIALIRMHSDVAGDSAGWIEQMGGGICLLTPWRAWWMQGGTKIIMSVAAHEIGHALGFGHGGNGSMVGRPKPNDEEVALAKAYYAIEEMT